MLGHPTRLRHATPKPVPAPAPVACDGEGGSAPTAEASPSINLLTPADVAVRLGVNPKMLERWRGTGEGPAYVRLNRKVIRYRLQDIEAYVTGKLRSNTAAA